MAENVVAIEEDDKSSENNKRRGGFLPFLFTVLKYFLFLVLIGLFVVAVSVITVRTLQKQSSITNTAGPIALNTQQTVPEDLDWFTQVGEIRGNLQDEARKTFIVDVYIGYKPTDQATLQELTRRRVQIRERVTLYFSSQYSQDLEGAQNFIRVKNELREIVNRTMNNKIREIAFNSFQIIAF